MNGTQGAPGPQAEPPASPPPLEGVERMAGAIVLAAATFMTVLDVTIANVSIPTIAGDLGVSPVQGTWILTSFSVANAIAMPLTGWLTTRRTNNARHIWRSGRKPPPNGGLTGT